MPLLTYYANNSVFAGSHYSSSTNAPAFSFAGNTSGWIVSSTAPPRFHYLDFQTENAQANGAATPFGLLRSGSAAGNAMFVIGPLNGTFTSSRWSITQSVKANTAGGEQDGGFIYRLFKGTNPTGSGAVLVENSYYSSSLATNLATGVSQVLTTSFSPGAITCSNEYIFVTCGWRTTGAGGGTTRDVNLYFGTATGSVVTTADFVTQSIIISAPTINYRQFSTGFFFS